MNRERDQRGSRGPRDQRDPRTQRDQRDEYRQHSPAWIRAQRRKRKQILRRRIMIGGAIIYYIVMNVVLWLKLPSDDLKLFSAIVVAVFLAIPYLKSTRKGKER